MTEGQRDSKSGYAVATPARERISGARIAILATKWNVELVDALVDGARRALSDRGIHDFCEHRVPGALELPVMAESLLRADRCDALVALGVIIRGDTPHFDLVAKECFRGLREASQRHCVALGVGVLAVNNVRQAAERSGHGNENKGYESTITALELLDSLRGLDV